MSLNCRFTVGELRLNIFKKTIFNSKLKNLGKTGKQNEKNKLLVISLVSLDVHLQYISHVLFLYLCIFNKLRSYCS